MTKPRQAKQTGDDDVRTYAWPPATSVGAIFAEPEFEVISVTSAKDAFPKPFLTPWAVKVTAEKAVEKYAFLGQMIEHDGAKGAIEWLKRARWGEAGAKADRGTIVHAALEAHIAGRALSKETITDMLKEKHVPEGLWKGTGGMIEALMRFLDDEQPEIYWSEQTVYSRTHGYAGTPDILALGTIGDSRLPVVYDVMTSKTVYDDTALQLVGYARADFVGLDDGTEAKLTPDDAPIEHGVVIRPMASGKYEKVVFSLNEDLFTLFLAVLHVATHQSLVKKARRP